MQVSGLRASSTGANKGDWTRSTKEIFPEAKFLMLEANELHRESLSKVGVPFRHAVLGATDGKPATFYLTKHTAFHHSNTGASMYREMSGIFDGELLEEKHVTMRTIDAVVSEAGLRDCRFHLVKLDVQGAEIEALKGAAETLKHAAVVFMELSVTPYNSGAPLWFETHLFMESIGYAAADVTELHYGGNGFLIQVDIMFSKKSLVPGVPSTARPTGFGSGNLTTGAKAFLQRLAFDGPESNTQ
jgi:FkbM family methyltransferase